VPRRARHEQQARRHVGADQAAIAANRGGMGSLSGLSTAQIDAIAAALK
jgi:hypothetical protein